MSAQHRLLRRTRQSNERKQQRSSSAPPTERQRGPALHPVQGSLLLIQLARRMVEPELEFRAFWSGATGKSDWALPFGFTAHELGHRLRSAQPWILLAIQETVDTMG